MADAPAFHDDAVENMLRPFRKKMTPNAVRRLREAGLDVEVKLKPKYPLAVHDAALRVLAEEFFPGETMDVATFKVGEAAIRVLEDWVLARTLMSMLRLLPLRTTLKRFPSMLRTGNNFVEATVQDLGPKRYALDINEVGQWPQYWVGLMGTANKVLLGHPRSTVVLKSYDGHRALIEFDLDPGT